MRILFLILLSACARSMAQSPYELLWNDAHVQERIVQGIEQHRKGEMTLVLKGKRIKNAEVTVQQVKHDFLFGANIFMLGGYPDSETNQKYEQAFVKIFNYASVPFYWKDLEPRPGEYRFGKESEPIFRRPAPDAVIEFCKRYGIQMKGHTLVWDSPTASMPAWAPKDPDSLRVLLSKRIQTIGERYKDQIPNWDVANETFLRHMQVPMPKDYVYLGFKAAEKHFNPSNQLIYNEVPEVFLKKNFRGEYSYLYVLLENLQLRGAKVGGIGLQFHLFPHLVDPKAVYAGTTQEFSPKAVWSVLDQLSHLNLPLNISEITFPVLEDTEAGRQKQAEVTRNFYRLFFSHPNMEAITWWNLPDGKAWGSEGQLKPGLLDENLDPKPAYRVLDQLINEEWNTRLNAKMKAGEPLQFKGFYGLYKVKISVGDTVVEREFRLSKGQKNRVEIKL